MDKKMTLQIENYNKLGGTLSNTNKHNTTPQTLCFCINTDISHDSVVHDGALI